MLYKTYLTETLEELETNNYILDRLFENIGDGDNINAEAFQRYFDKLTEATEETIGRTARYVRHVFGASGMTLSADEIRSIVTEFQQQQTGMADEKVKLQKAMYIIAGLGSSLSVNQLIDAYTTGDPIRFVAKNIGKVDLKRVADGSTIRVCIGTFGEKKPSLGMIYYTLKYLNDKGEKGIKFLNSHYKKESVEDEEFLGEAKVNLKKAVIKAAKDAKRDVETKAGTVDLARRAIKAKAKTNSDFKKARKEYERIKTDPETHKPHDPKIDKDFKELHDKVKDRNMKYDILITAGAAVAVGAASDIAMIYQFIKTGIMTKRNATKMKAATAVFINESEVLFRLFSGASNVNTVRISGKKIAAVRETLVEMCNIVNRRAKELKPDQVYVVNGYAEQVDMFFAALATR